MADDMRPMVNGDDEGDDRALGTDFKGRPLLAAVLLDLALQPDRLLELEDTPSREEKVALLAKWYPGLVEGGRGLLVENNLHQIRVSIDAEVVSSPGHTLAITWLVITF